MPPVEKNKFCGNSNARTLRSARNSSRVRCRHVRLVSSCRFQNTGKSASEAQSSRTGNHAASDTTWVPVLTIASASAGGRCRGRLDVSSSRLAIASAYSQVYKVYLMLIEC